MTWAVASTSPPAALLAEPRPRSEGGRGAHLSRTSDTACAPARPAGASGRAAAPTVRRVSSTLRPARDPLAFVTTLTRLPSRAEVDSGDPDNHRTPLYRTPGQSGRLSPRDAELRYGAA